MSDTIRILDIPNISREAIDLVRQEVNEAVVPIAGDSSALSGVNEILKHKETPIADAALVMYGAALVVRLIRAQVELSQSVVE